MSKKSQDSRRKKSAHRLSLSIKITSGSRQGGYIMSVKGNQSRLHDEIRDPFTSALRQLDPADLDPQCWSFA